jgi:hypothetical protein
VTCQITNKIFIGFFIFSIPSQSSSDITNKKYFTKITDRNVSLLFSSKNNDEIFFVNVSIIICQFFYSEFNNHKFDYLNLFFFKSNKLFTWSLFIKQPRTKLFRFNLMNETSKKKIKVKPRNKHTSVGFITLELYSTCNQLKSSHNLWSLFLT